MLGPRHRHLPQGVVFEDLGSTWVLRAEETVQRTQVGVFAEPWASIEIRTDELTADGPVDLLGFGFTQFAMPVTGGPGRPFVFNPAPNLNSPAAVVPVVFRAGDGSVLLLAPLDSWHEQIVAVVQDESGVQALRWGWHGDLHRVEAGFASTLGLFPAPSATEAFERWGTEVTTRAGTRRADPSVDPVTSKLSYWTDNGAAYWYRTEPGQDLASTLEAKMAELDELGVTIGAVELDSWFYPHEIGRQVAEVGYLDEVPPTGMLSWTPRPDVLPAGIPDLARRLGGRPLILHARHISPRSPYLAEGEWWTDLAAHPVDPTFFDRWFDDAASWGATCVEQDWMIMSWFGVRGLREEPGRASAWQRALDESAGARGMSLIWCMASPGDVLASVELVNVAAVRTSDDYRYAEDPAVLWRWYLVVNRLASSLRLPVFKDCFMTSKEAGTSSIDGDPHAEVEALLSAMSAGVVGIGDRLGRTDPALLSCLCLPDGSLVQPDRPLAVSDVSFFDGADDPVPLWAETCSGEVRYVVALHAASTESPVKGGFELGREYLVYEWRTGQARPAARIDVTLEHRGWALYVCCPISNEPPPVLLEAAAPADWNVARRWALIGDPSKFATMGSARIHSDGTTVPTSGETSVPVRWWIEGVGIAGALIV